MQPNKEVLRKEEEEPPAEPRVWIGHWCCQNTPEHGDSGVLGKNQGPQRALLRPPISNQGFPLAKPDTKPEGQGAQVVLSVAVSLPVSMSKREQRKVIITVGNRIYEER